MARVNILTMGEKNIREDDLQNVHSTNKVENQFYGWRTSASGSEPNLLRKLTGGGN